MADIFEIVGRFAIDGADKAKKEINDVAGAGEKSSSALGKFGKVVGTVGKGVLAVGGAVSAGSVALVKSVQSSYGELQQNLGGSEAVYGQYASNIQEIAKDAYKNMGMSQSEYLATANKMGSLFQGSGIKQKEALDMTTKAMQRASDVASVMGIDMSMAMESIAGAAKGNFTMMDNLGVAMNATTLESYAMSKGMTDFSWKSASSAEKNALAMQMFLERTEQYAGNFARESTDTISGSIGYLGAAWDDFKAGLGNPTADMARLTNNLAQSFGAMINNIVPIIENIANALPTVLPSIVNAISNLAPTLIQTFTDVITKMIDAVIPLLPTVIPLFVDMLVKIGMALAQNAPVLIDGFIQLITQLSVAIAQNLPGLIPIFIDCMVQIASAIVQNAPIILDAILSIGSNFENGLSPAISACIGLVEVLAGAFVTFKAGAMIQGVVQGFQSAQVALALFKMETQGASIAQGLLNGQLTIGQTVVGLLTGQVTLAEIATGLWSKAQAVLNAVMSANPIALIVMAIGAVIAIIVVAYNKCEWFRNAVNAVGNGIKNAFIAVVNWFKTLPETLSNVFTNIITKVTAFVTTFVNKAKEAGTNFANNLINFIKDLPNKISTLFTNIVTKVTSFVSNFVNKAREAGTNFVNNLVNFIQALPGRVSAFLTNTISNVSSFVSQMIAKAREAGTNFINNITSALSALPGQIAGFFSTVISNLASFVSQMIAKAIEAGQGFVTNIMGTLNGLPGQVVSIGTQVVTGIWNGISGGMGWLLGQLQSWCGSIVNAIKGWFGIHSPSRVMRDEVGKPIVDGVAVGIKENSGEVSEEFQKMLDDLQLQRDLDVINDDEYYSQLETLRDTYLERGTKDWWQYTKEIIDYENEVIENEKQTFEELNNDYEDHLQQRKDLTDNFYNKLSKYPLYNTYSFTDKNGTETWYKLNDWSNALESLDFFENRIMTVQERLKNVFAGDNESLQSILDEIRGSALTDEGVTLINTMFDASDEEFEKFASGYKQFIEKSKRITNSVYADDLAELDNSFLQKISEKFANSPLLDQIKDFGANMSESLMNGIESKGEWLKEQIINFCNSVSQTFGNEFSVGNNLQLSGVNEVGAIRNYQVDYTPQLNNINDTIDRFISLVGEYLPNISQKMDRPIIIDGNSLAAGIARKMDSQLGKLTIAKGRGNV